jgi:hypothetical protein
MRKRVRHTDFAGCGEKWNEALRHDGPGFSALSIPYRKSRRPIVFTCSSWARVIRVNSATPEGKRFQIIHRIASLEQLIGSASCFNHRVGTEHLIRMLAAREKSR